MQENTVIASTEQLHGQIANEVAHYTGGLLEKTYPGYGWAVRVLQVFPVMIGFTLVELMKFGEDQVMALNPMDYGTRHEFDKLVKYYGGELLERARLSRAGSKEIEPESRPDGFNPRFDKTKRIIVQ